jgi:uncharacterized membrane protein
MSGYWVCAPVFVLLVGLCRFMEASRSGGDLREAASGLLLFAAGLVGTVLVWLTWLVLR